MLLPHRPSLNEKIFFFISGFITSAPFPFLVTSLASYFLVLNLPELSAQLISIVVIAPILEEFAKAYPLFYRHGETEKSLMTLGFLTGLGFGLAEFLFYVFVIGVPVFIRIPGLIFHSTNTAVTAYGIGKNKSLFYYLIAVGLHSLSNFSAITGNLWLWGSIGAIIISYILAKILYRRAKEEPIDHWTQK